MKNQYSQGQFRYKRPVIANHKAEHRQLQPQRFLGRAPALEERELERPVAHEVTGRFAGGAVESVFVGTAGGRMADVLKDELRCTGQLYI